MVALSGEIGGRFRITGRLGAGGMGEVYRAVDERLGREVAVKVLPPELASDIERLRRFEGEARATAALDHPNILAIHDVGMHEGSPYLVEELLEGESLRERLRDGPLPVRRAVKIATAIANGLAAAHEKGIVHRDLKPENVFLTTAGVVKILDLGLAKLTRPDDEANRSTVPTASAPHTVLGTVGYMAPEQVRGAEVDHRADIFALGCVIHEMLTGRRTFAGATSAEVMSAILTQAAAPLPPEVGGPAPALEHIVQRCLEKRPEERFQSAADLAHDLAAIATREVRAGPAAPPASARPWRVVGMAAVAAAALVAVGALVTRVVPWRTASPPAAPPRIVVLPFENLGAPQDDYFADGMAEEITSRLANVRGLAVISRTTAVGYDRTGKTVKEIGADLGVDYVLEGSVRWEHGEGGGDRVRITPQLIRVADDTHVWADRYDRVLADVFALQSDVAENVVRALGVALMPHEQSALRDVSTNDLEAYDLYLRGRALFAGGFEEGRVRRALRTYRAAVDRDPGFAQALAELARCNLMLYWLYYDHSPRWVADAKDAAERSVALRPDLAEPHAALGWLSYQGLLDYPRALAEFRKALRIQPSNADALLGIGCVVRRQGKWAESADVMKRAIDIDPKNALLVFNFAQSCRLAGRYDEAIRACELAEALSPGWVNPYALHAGLEIAGRGDLDRAEAVLEAAMRTVGTTAGVGQLRASAANLAVDTRHDHQTILHMLEEAPPGPYETQFYFQPAALLRALVQQRAGLAAPARASFEAARIDLEQRIAQAPEDHRLHGSLAIAYAGLDRTEDAVREARLGCSLMPPSKDAWRAQARLHDLAVVYAMLGRTREAVATLDDLLGRSAWYTAHTLRLDPAWDPLRSDPRFQALLTRYAVAERSS